MKCILSFVLPLVPLLVHAQSLEAIRPRKLEISSSRTTHLILPSRITYVDLGSAEIMASRAQGSDNVLRIRASKEDFEPTSLTVITESGGFYPFMCFYAYSPSDLCFRVSDSDDSPSPEVMMNDLDRTPASSIGGAMEKVRKMKCDPEPGSAVRQGGMEAVTEGVFSAADHMFLRIRIRNLSPFSFAADDLKFFRITGKRGSEAERQVRDVEIRRKTGLEEPVPSGGEALLVVCLKPFTPTRGGRLLCQITELREEKSMRFAVDVSHPKPLR